MQKKYRSRTDRYKQVDNNRDTPWLPDEMVTYRGYHLIYESDGRTIDAIHLPGGVTVRASVLFAEGAVGPKHIRRTKGSRSALMYPQR